MSDPYATDLFGNPDAPTTAAELEQMTHADLVARNADLVALAHTIVDDALAVHLDGRELVATVLLFSGGNDSTVLGHLMRERVTVAAHANTGIGIEQTREFVRDTCKAWGLPLMERHAPTSYRDLVIERGFPGPAMHFKYYQRLKERQLKQVRRELVTNPRKQRVMFLAGRRRAESNRRAMIPLYERRGSVIWASPLAMWTALDMAIYQELNDVPTNPVSQLLHMSGECLCGAFAHPGELDEIGYWFPETKAEIEALEAEVRAAGHPEPLCKWGHGQGRPTEDVGALCSSCTLWSEELADE